MRSPRFPLTIRAWSRPTALLANGHDDHDAALSIGNDRCGQQPTIDAVIRMGVVVAYDLEAAERPDGGADDDVTRPVPVVVHARDGDERRTSVHHRCDVPDRLRPPLR